MPTKIIILKDWRHGREKIKPHETVQRCVAVHKTYPENVCDFFRLSGEDVRPFIILPIKRNGDVYSG